MKNLINRIKHWFWWHFKATESDKALEDTIVYGMSFMKNGKRINPLLPSTRRCKKSIDKHIQFAKLFYKPEEGEMYSPSIVAYRKTPEIMETVDMGNGEGKTIVKSYKRKLFINLWFVELRFVWTN